MYYCLLPYLIFLQAEADLSDDDDNGNDHDGPETEFSESHNDRSVLPLSKEEIETMSDDFSN